MTKEHIYEYKEQIIKECQETGNVALVAQCHNILLELSNCFCQNGR